MILYCTKTAVLHQQQHQTHVFIWTARTSHQVKNNMDDITIASNRRQILNLAVFVI